jgi:hypothetical protein
VTTSEILQGRGFIVHEPSRCYWAPHIDLRRLPEFTYAVSCKRILASEGLDGLAQALTEET